MRRFAGRVVVLVVVFATSGVGAAADKDKLPDYFPLKVGTKRHYRVDANGQPGQLTTQIARIEKIDGQDLARLESLTSNRVSATEHLSSSVKGIFRHRINGIEAVPPVCVLKYPVEEGQSWEEKSKLGPQTMKITSKVTGLDASIRVPAGEYKTVRVEATADLAEMKITTTYWFAPGVGIVKQVATFGANTITMELEKFEAGK